MCGHDDMKITKYPPFFSTEKYHLTYKFVKTECKLVRSILGVHCFREVRHSVSVLHSLKVQLKNSKKVWKLVIPPKIESCAL